MQLAELVEETGSLAKVAIGIGIKPSQATTVRRYRDGTRIPDRERMRRIVIFSEGRVTPNDIYGLTELIAECLEKRARRLACRKGGRPPHPELPLGDAA